MRGLRDGSIRVLNRATLGATVERTMAGHTDTVFSLVLAGEWLISGSDDRTIRGRGDGELRTV